MKIIPIDQLCAAMDTNIQFINALRQDWRKTNRFSCIGKPKLLHILVYFHDCTACLHTADGQETKIEENSIMYAPQGAQYTLDVYPQTETGGTVGVNVLLFDGQGAALALADGVTLFPAGGGCGDGLTRWHAGRCPPPCRR